jgi:transposase
VSHASARLNLFGRGLLIARVLEEGWTAAAAAEASGVSRATVYKWLARFRSEGVIGLCDRSSCPVRSPRRLSASSEQRILQLRRRRKLGPHRLGAILGCPARRAMRCSADTGCRAGLDGSAQRGGDPPL